MTSLLFRIITYVPECLGTMGEYILGLSPLAMDEVYNAYWRICEPNFNFSVLKNSVKPSGKSRVRAATRTLVFVVATYLLSNILNVIITIWEYIDYESITVTFNTFYTFAVDVVSLLTIFAGSLRLPIYVCCQTELRKDFIAQLKKICYRSPYKLGGTLRDHIGAAIALEKEGRCVK
ncbi:hypothetical protein OSTOST_04875 [Ostertagia ostertagi]